MDTLILRDKYQGAGGLLRPVQPLHTIFHLHHCLHHFITYHPHHKNPSSHITIFHIFTTQSLHHHIPIFITHSTSPSSPFITIHHHPYLFGVPHNMAARRTRAQLRPSQSKAAITTTAPVESPTTESLSENQQAPSVIVVCPPSGEVPSKVPPRKPLQRAARSGESQSYPTCWRSSHQNLAYESVINNSITVEEPPRRSTTHQRPTRRHEANSDQEPQMDLPSNPPSSGTVKDTSQRTNQKRAREGELRSPYPRDQAN